MRSVRFVSLLVLLVFARSATAQQATSSTPQATALLQQALVALSGGHPLTDVTLSGTARRIAGSDDDSGTVVVKALAGTGTRIDLTLNSGPHCEIRNTSGTVPTGSWSGIDGAPHTTAYDNLLTDPGWFPALALSNFLSAQNAVITYVGPETRDSKSLIHISASKQFPSETSDTASLLQHLTEIDVYLDSTTFLPAILTFNAHPDNNAKLDIPVELLFSDYRSVNGTQIPFHVQKIINNVLALDLEFDSAIVNTGVSASTFAVSVGL
jgi:hypothetical protein